MEGRELPVRTGEEAARVVRALGQHRYVASRLHLVHAFTFAALSPDDTVADATAWAHAVLADPHVDAASKDERLYRRASEAEVAAVLGAFWAGDADAVRFRLRERLAAAQVPVPEHEPFDESREEEVFPALVDAGWELLPLGALDPDRHKGAILAFGEPIAFEVAKFEEEAPRERPVHLQELPLLGAVELLRGAHAGVLAHPLVLWTEGPNAYHDYVIRGVLRAAKLET